MQKANYRNKMMQTLKQKATEQDTELRQELFKINTQQVATLKELAEHIRENNAKESSS